MLKYSLSFIISVLVVFQLAATSSSADAVMVEQIFNRLTKAVGDYSNQLPKVVIRPLKRYGASYKRSENTIYIDQAALDVCNSFGSDAESAIAFLLGHELTHYYQKHDWQEASFTTGFLTSKKTFQQNIHHEEEADRYSGFITHLAGYNSIKILPQLLDKIYEVYKLNGKKLNTYPSLTERKSLAQEVCKTVQGLIEINRAANYLYALGKYEEALVSYEYLLKYVKYKELYNNIGLCALYTAMPLVQRKMPFVYPLSLDPSIPLRAPSGFTKEELMQKAIKHFSIATTFNASYFLSYLNLICAYDLNLQFNAANMLLDQFQSLATTPKQQQQLTILKGILAYHNNVRDIAKGHFKTVSKDVRFPDLANIATQNLNILAGHPLISKVNTTILPVLEDKIEGIQLLFFEGDDSQNSFTLRDTPTDTKSISIQQLSNSTIYIFNTNELLTKSQFTQSINAKTTKGIGISSTHNQIESTYPMSNKRSIPHLNGYYLVIPAKGLFFDLNQRNEVVSWGVYLN